MIKAIFQCGNCKTIAVLEFGQPRDVSKYTDNQQCPLCRQKKLKFWML